MVMLTARLPFKRRDTDEKWLTATVLIPETMWDRLRLLFGRYKLGTSAMFGRIHYDPESVRATASASSPSAR